MTRYDDAIEDMEAALEQIEAEHGEADKRAAIKRAFTDEFGDEFKMVRR